jgi:hypothetical protein
VKPGSFTTKITDRNQSPEVKYQQDQIEDTKRIYQPSTDGCYQDDFIRQIARIKLLVMLQ